MKLSILSIRFRELLSQETLRMVNLDELLSILSIRFAGGAPKVKCEEFEYLSILSIRFTGNYTAP